QIGNDVHHRQGRRRRYDAGRRSVGAGDVTDLGTVGGTYGSDITAIAAVTHRRDADGDGIALTEHLRHQALAPHVVAAVTLELDVTRALGIADVQDQAHVGVGEARF